jgi:NADP-dependent 3-hydroxy acid dehydrogenase YdfG
MVKQGFGHIITIGSVAGVESYAKGGVYCATKHAVHAISQSLREEMVEHGIKVSEILPGAVNTEFSQVRFHGDKSRADSVYQGFESLQASDVAELIVYNANLPKHVNLAESLILAGAQSRATKIHRQ